MWSFSHVPVFVMVHCVQALSLSLSECASANKCTTCTFHDVQFTNAQPDSFNKNIFDVYSDPTSKGIVPIYHIVKEWNKGASDEYPCLPSFQKADKKTADDLAAEFYGHFYRPQLSDLKVAASVVLTSFGSRAEIGGFQDTSNLVAKMDYTAGEGSGYLDANALPRLVGAYRDYDDLARMYVSRHVFWKEYYKYQMRTARVMVLLITDAWLDSENCWEELGWAANGDPEAEVPNPYRVPTHENMFINMVYLISDRAKAHYYDNGAGTPEFHETSTGAPGGVIEPRMIWFNKIAEANVYIKGVLPTVCQIGLELGRKWPSQFRELSTTITKEYSCAGTFDNWFRHPKESKTPKFLH